MDAELGEWIRDNVASPNSMVDRITPETTDADRADVAERGYKDTWPVVSENFCQWGLEDSFTAGRPAYEDAWVEVVADVEPYELMKPRLLNASHQGLCYLGYLAGHRMVHEVMAEPRFRENLAAGRPVALAAARQGADPLAFLRQREVIGDLVDSSQFTRAYVSALESPHTVGGCGDDGGVGGGVTAWGWWKVASTPWGGQPTSLPDRPESVDLHRGQHRRAEAPGYGPRRW